MKEKQFDMKTGVIGVGSMGQNHARVYSEISDLSGVVDANLAQAKQVGNRFGCPFYSDYKELLENVDAVSIAVPTALHKQVAIDAASAGVDILVEKPLAGGINEGKEIVKTCEEAGITLAVGHIERHNPIILYAYEAIKRGEWGNIITMSSRRVSSYPARIKDVGVVFDLAIHDIDVMRFLCGSEIDSVYALGGRSADKVHEDHISLLLEFSSGKEGVCEANWLTPMKVRQLTLTCSTHFVDLNYINQSISVSTSHFVDLDEANLFTAALEVERRMVSLTKKEPLKNELIDFLRSAKEKSEPLVTGRDGLQNLIIAEAALESIKGKKRISVESIRP